MTAPLLWAAAPAIILTVGALVLLMLSAFRSGSERAALPVALATLIAAAAAVICIATWPRNPAGMPMLSLRLDGFAVVVDVVLLALAMLAAMVAEPRLAANDLERPEFYALTLFATAGATLMVGAGDLIIFFLGLEVLSIASYVLAGFARRDKASNEAALKYFILGSLASAMMLFGIALLYGATGGFSYSAALHLVGRPDLLPLWLGGFALLLVGIGFKAGLAPFHSWVPDVYEGAPTPTTVYMASVVKVAAFAPLLRFAVEALPHRADWAPAVWAIALLTMTVGNLGALWQANVKRLLAYSSIAQAGYLLLAVWAADPKSLIFYLAAYATASIGAFGLIGILETDYEKPGLAEQFAGLGKRLPAAAFAMTLFMLSLAGLPVTAGLAGKIFLFRAALAQGGLWLTILAALNTVVSVAYYLRIVAMMYMSDPTGHRKVISARIAWVAIGLCAAITLLLGAFPDLLWRLLEQAKGY
jgi:NADH-quinone oxidoreductase subunit N